MSAVVVDVVLSAQERPHGAIYAARVSDTTAEVTDLLQQLIRNGCVNDGRTESGGEVRSADLLASYLDGPGLELERYESAPGRVSLVARIDGSDPAAPALVLMGHTDVVPANPAGWQRDPFGGELVDGMVWGRGAVDMLNLTASMAVATKHLADSGFRPKGSLIYFAVADEEALGAYGAGHLVTTRMPSEPTMSSPNRAGSRCRSPRRAARSCR